MAAVTALAFVVRLVPALRGGGLTGATNYDPSVYYAAAVGLASGRLPYRDFLLLHPPGILILLQPFALLGQWVGEPLAFAVARTSFMVIGSASAAVVFLLLRPHGAAAALVGAGCYAVNPAAAHVERATWLEAPASLMLVLALLALRPATGRAPARRFVLAGALLGFAGLVKLWGFALLVAVVVWVLLREGLRAAMSCLLGTLLAAAAALTPFAPAIGALWQDVVAAQVQRPPTRSDPVVRGLSILGFDQASAAAVPLLAALALFTATLVIGTIAARTPAGGLPVALAAVTVSVLLLSPAWYPNYAAFAAAPLALVAGVATGATTTLAVPARAVTVGTAGVVVVLGAAAHLGSTDGYPFPGTQLGAVLDARPGCVTTDHPLALILSDRLRPDLREGCPLVVDLSGYIHVLPGENRRSRNPAFQETMMGYLSGGRSTVIMSGLWPRDFSPESRAIVESWPVVGMAGDVTVRNPKG